MTDAVQIRPAEPSDIEALIELFEQVAAERRWIAQEAPIDRERNRTRWLESIASDEAAVFIAVAGGEIVGNIGLSSHRGLVELGMLVADEWRGRGVGTALLQAGLDWAHEIGAYKMTLQVWPHNEAAIKLYEKFGFEREGYLRKQWRRRSGELWDSVVMGLVLVDGEAVNRARSG